MWIFFALRFNGCTVQGCTRILWWFIHGDGFFFLILFCSRVCDGLILMWFSGRIALWFRLQFFRHRVYSSIRILMLFDSPDFSFCGNHPCRPELHSGIVVCAVISDGQILWFWVQSRFESVCVEPATQCLVFGCASCFCLFSPQGLFVRREVSMNRGNDSDTPLLNKYATMNCTATKAKCK